MSQITRFEAFVREYQDMVFATAVRLLGNPADAEDVAQTTFLRAFERFDRLCDSPTAAGWLKTVTTNLCLNHLDRYRSRWRLFSELDPEGDGRSAFSESVRSEDDGPLDAAVVRDRDARLDAALRALPPHQRVPIVLFHFDGLSYEAIAERLDVSLGKVKTDIHRGRLALRAALAPFERSVARPVLARLRPRPTYSTDAD